MSYDNQLLQFADGKKYTYNFRKIYNYSFF